MEAIAGGRYDRPLLPWVPLMRGGSEPSVIARWVELAAGEPDDRKRATLGYEALVFAEKSDDPGAWHKALEGWAVVKSKVMEATREEGRVEGRVEGRAEARIEERQNVVLRILRVRTQREVPADLADKVHATGDQALLEGWIDAAAVATDLDAFRRETGL